MQGVVKARLLSFLAGLVVVPAVTILVVMFARGYRPDIPNGRIQATGLLVAHSYPDSAQIYINGQLQPSVTNTSFNLSPSQYQVEIKKEGYQLWKKNLTIEKEIVTTASPVLFPSVPALKSVTNTGAVHPTLSTDGTKVVYTPENSSKVFILDLNESPLGLFNRESQLAATLPVTPNSIAKFIWSPDSRQFLAIMSPELQSASFSAYLIDPGSSQTSNVSANVNFIIEEWKQRQKTKEVQQFSSLSPLLSQILATSSANLTWSPKENKLLYTATASATIPDNIKKPLPGSSTQAQNRQLSTGHTYVYDIEEDRNFEITGPLILPSPTPKPARKNTSKSLATKTVITSHPSGWSWFPTSSHLFKVEAGQISVIEYDNQNSTIVYAGPLSNNIAIPYPSGKQMLILTNLTTSPAASQSAYPNLYALTLR